MGTQLAIILDAYSKTPGMCLGFVLFYGAVALLAYTLNVEDWDFEIPARTIFWACLIPGFILMAVCLVLIDKPHWAVPEKTLQWMFMFSAFLGIPAALPFLAGAVWASALRTRDAAVEASSLALVMLGTFGLGCAASNIHDVAWCAAITDNFTKHFTAGYDLDYFVAFGGKFGISREVLADYATLGPCAFVMVAGELAVAIACFVRLAKLPERF